MKDNLLILDDKITCSDGDFNDKIIYYNRDDKQYMIPVKKFPCLVARKGIPIKYCPWCGKFLSDNYIDNDICFEKLYLNCKLMRQNLYIIKEKISYDGNNVNYKTVYYNSKFDEYGIPIVDNYKKVSSSYVSISFCPWCGKVLPESKRDLWFDELEKLGFDDPFEQSIPERFKTSKWYKSI